jgi:hypothetical protein
MATIIRYVQNDHGLPLGLALQNADSSVFNLAGYSLAINAQFANTSGLKFTGAMAIDSGAAGQCHYTPAATDFNEAGNYNVQVVATQGSMQVTWNDIVVIVEPSLPSF